MEMELGSINKINEMLNQIPVTPENEDEIENAKQAMADQDYITALTIINSLNAKVKVKKVKDNKESDTEYDEEDYDEDDENKNLENTDEEVIVPVEIEEKKEYTFENENGIEKYPKELSNIELEKIYIGLLLQEPKLIVRYHILFDDCFFESESLLNIYKSILFTEGGDYTPERAKQKFNFSKEVEGIYQKKK